MSDTINYGIAVLFRGPVGEPNIIIVLNGCSNKLLPKPLSLF